MVASFILINIKYSIIVKASTPEAFDIQETWNVCVKNTQDSIRFLERLGCKIHYGSTLKFVNLMIMMMMMMMIFISNALNPQKVF